jgi:hypothetical protein
MHLDGMVWENLKLDVAKARYARAMVSFVLDVTINDDNERGSYHAAYARRIAMYLSHTAFGMSIQRVALAFERDRSTVATACHRIEDLREDKEFDRFLAGLSASISKIPESPTLPVIGKYK